MLNLFKKTTISQAVDTLISQIDQGIHRDLGLFMQGKLPTIFKIVDKQERKRIRDLEAKIAEMNRANREMATLQQKVKDLDSCVQSSFENQNSNKQKVISLLSYIETREIEPGSELEYLVAFAEGAKAEYLEKFIVK